MERSKRNLILTFVLSGAFIALSFWVEHNMDDFVIRLLNMWGIYVIMVVSFNLVYGFTGQFSLAHAGLAAIGAYTVSLLTLSPESKQLMFLFAPPINFIATAQWPFLPALILGGILAAVIGFLIGGPALRLHGDYLLIVTFGFSEIIRLVLVNIPTVTNGAMGLKGIPYLSSLTMVTTWAVICVMVTKRLVNSSYGRAFKCVREDDIAAEAVGINLFRHKTMAFIFSSFFAGIAGGLLAEILGTIDPNAFRPALTYAVVTMAVLGGIKSLTGGIFAAGIYTAMSEVLRSIENPRMIFGFDYAGIPGLRTLAFAIMLLLLILFYRKGLFGDNELSWNWIFSKIRSLFRIGKGADTREHS
jgi:branched-chain amino acid transport system permease protein